MSWLWFLQIMFLIFFLYLCICGIVDKYFKSVAICEAVTYQVIGDYRKANGVDLV